MRTPRLKKNGAVFEKNLFCKVRYSTIFAKKLLSLDPLMVLSRNLRFEHSNVIVF